MSLRKRSYSSSFMYSPSTNWWVWWRATPCPGHFVCRASTASSVRPHALGTSSSRSGSYSRAAARYAARHFGKS